MIEYVVSISRHDFDGRQVLLTMERGAKDVCNLSADVVDRVDGVFTYCVASGWAGGVVGALR